MELIDGIEPVCRDFIYLPGEKNREVQDNAPSFLDEQVSCDENDDTNTSTESKVDPRMGSENGVKFEKSENIENSIFSPNNSAGNRNLGKATKNGQIKLDEQPVTKTPKNTAVLQKISNLKNCTI